MNQKQNRVYILALAMAVLLALAIYGEPAVQTFSNQLLGPNKLAEAFRESGAEFEEYTITGWVQLNDQWVDNQVLRNAANRAALQLGVDPQELVETIREESGFRGLRLAGKLNRATYIEIFVQTMQNTAIEQLNRAESYTLITVTSTAEPEQLAIHRSEVNDALEAASQLPPVSIANTGIRAAKVAEIHTAEIIKGSYRAQLTLKASEKKVAQLFERLKARKLEGVSTKELVSWSGYSPILPDKLEVNHKTINLNIATRYSSSLQKTYLLMATPIISIEY